MVESFGSWLLAQASRSDAIGALAKVAKTDRQFPRNGDVAAVYARLNVNEADGEMYEAVEEAEAEWRAVTGE
jgi:uncharacterized protein YozE (UPF0346 family)